MLIQSFFASSILGSLSSGLRTGETAPVFAADIAHRISGTPGTGEVAPVAPETDSDEALKFQHLRKLESSLADTVAYMRENHGEKAAAVLMALVYRRLGGGEVTEETLGNAFLDVTRFIDKHFGTDAGDRFMDHLNGSLNESLNAYFDNGYNETFFAVSVPAISWASERQDAAGGERHISDAVLEMLEQIHVKRERKENPLALYGQEQPGWSLMGVLRDIMV